MKEFTEEELALYNGKNGRQAYVAYREKCTMYLPVFSGKTETIKFFMRQV